MSKLQRKKTAFWDCPGQSLVVILGPQRHTGL
jgi:hypothetical protein